MRRKDREVTSAEEISALLDGCRTCHLAMNDGGYPYIVPLNYGYEMNDGVLKLYFHCAAEGKKTDLLESDGRVCFEICEEGEAGETADPCAFGYSYFSVVGRGDASFVSEDGEKCAAMKAICRQHLKREVVFQPAQVAQVRVFKVVSADFTAKRRKNK